MSKALTDLPARIAGISRNRCRPLIAKDQTND